MRGIFFSLGALPRSDSFRSLCWVREVAPVDHYYTDTTAPNIYNISSFAHLQHEIFFRKPALYHGRSPVAQAGARYRRYKMALRLVEKAADDRRMAKTAEMLAPTTETVKGDSISAGVLIEVLRLSHGSQPSSTSCVPLSDSNSETRDAISISLKPKG